MSEEQKRQQEVAKGLDEFLRTNGVQLRAVPGFRLRDDGTFSVVVEVQLAFQAPQVQANGLVAAA